MEKINQISRKKKKKTSTNQPTKKNPNKLKKTPQNPTYVNPSYENMKILLFSKY